MLGWFKLLEKFRKSDAQSNDSTRSLTNSNLNHTSSRQQNSFSNPSNTNGHILRSSETVNTPITLDSPPNIFNSPSIISITSTPRPIIDDPPFVDTEPVSTVTLEKELEMESTITTASSSSAASTGIRFVLICRT